MATESSHGNEPDVSAPATSAKLPYATAAAFHAALKAKFTEIAEHDFRFSVAELQRQFAYDRILSRCFSADDADRWMLKGAGALLARLPVARHSKDLDLYTPNGPPRPVPPLLRWPARPTAM